MADQLGSAHFQAVFDSALEAYEKKTGVKLAQHPLAMELQSCDCVDSIITLLRSQAQDFRHNEKIMKSITTIVSVLTPLSLVASFPDAVGLNISPATAIHTGIGILLDAAKAMTSTSDVLIDLLESMERLVSRLRIYTEISLPSAMVKIMVNIMVELISTLGLVTEKLKQHRQINFIKDFIGDKDIKAVLQRLDRLTQDEVRTTTTQTLGVICGLVQNMREFMDDGKASIDGFREALELLHQVASDMSKLKRDKMQQDIRSWLSPPDPWKNHNLARRSRHDGTGTWFIRGNTLSEWKTSGTNSLLWVIGKPGSGKSVLCSAIIDEIDAMRKSGLASLAFYYNDFREDQKRYIRGLLSSVLSQLCVQSDVYHDVLSIFYSKHRYGAQKPSDNELLRCFKDLLALPGQAPIYLIIDALDECPITSAMPSPREEVLMLVEQLIESRLSNLRICVTSRLETVIKVVLEPLTFRSISIHDERGHIQDIENYIRSVVNTDPKNRRWKQKDKQLMIDVLTSRADGMFRWVYCQVVYLRGCHPGRIRHALAELPETLNETYERTLREINEADWELAHRLFQCIAIATRPLRVEELAEIFALDFRAGPIPKFREDWRLGDPVEAVLSICTTLISLVNVENSQVLQFSHFSVREFLTSTRLAENRDTISRRYHISSTPAHTLVVQACLGTLLHLDENVTRDILKTFPLAEYAARHWFEHARFEVPHDVGEGMKQLFDRRKPHLAVWLWIYDPIAPFWKPLHGPVERPWPPRGTPIHYAAFCGLHDIVNALAIEQSQDVHSRRFDDRSTPLHMASKEGHLGVARVLVEHGADAAAKDGMGSTPLHWASESGQVELARFLVEHGADAAARDEGGWTPLHRASSVGRMELARFLVEHGADTTATDFVGSTPLHWAASMGHLELAKFLVEHGADAAAKDVVDRTPLHGASDGGHVKLARFLVEYGADTAAKDRVGSTPLHRASLGGHLELARFLVEYGADVAAEDVDGLTPQHRASEGGHLELARFLVEHGGDAAAKDNQGFQQSTTIRISGSIGRVILF